jgi:hypothetical protein
LSISLGAIHVHLNPATDLLLLLTSDGNEQGEPLSVSPISARRAALRKHFVEISLQTI